MTGRLSVLNASPNARRYLFNARGVAASFRYRHLFMCGSVVLNVDPGEWQEFWYPALREYIHYIPIKKDMSDAESQIQWLRV